MAIIPIVEGQIPFEYPLISKECFTFYKIIGDLTSTNQAPLICLHGGPGAGHEYLIPFGDLWSARKIPVILYDQIGCASSTHLRERKGDDSLWREELFVAQFWTVVKHLKLERYHILGHSWGAGLAAAIASTNPSGFGRLIVLGGLVDVQIANKSLHRLVQELPPNLRDVIVKHDEDQDYDKEEYSAALEYFYKKHAYRDEPFPGEYVGRALANFGEDDTSVVSAAGEKFMTCTGSLRDWTVIPRLPDIEASTLVIDGEYDYAPVKAFFDGIRKVKWVTIMGGAHMCFLEVAGKVRVLNIVGEFLEDKSTES